MSFVFYDVETTGTNTVFDQILQFAAVKTDTDLNPLERFSTRCRLLPWVVPSPGALAVTGVSAELLFDQRLPSHFDMMREVQAKLAAWSPSTFVGFNSRRFDEDVLRRAFWQTLHPPYLTVTGGNRRLDILVLARATALLVPDALLVPLTAEGKRTFRLDQLASANGFVHTQAHEALSDAEATVFLARRIRDRAPLVWKTGVANAPKAIATKILSKREPLFFAQGEYGWFGLPIGRAADQDEKVIVANLSEDWGALRQLPAQELSEKLAKSLSILSIVPLNRVPFFLEAETAGALGRTISGAQRANLEVLNMDLSLCARIISSVSAPSQEPREGLELEERIFHGFPDHHDTQLMKQFHQLEWPGRRALLEKFNDPRLRQLGRRLCFVDAPLTLDPSERKSMAQAIAHRVLGSAPQARWRDLRAARAEMVELGANELVAKALDAVERELLRVTTTD